MVYKNYELPYADDEELNRKLPLYSRLQNEPTAAIPNNPQVRIPNQPITPVIAPNQTTTSPVKTIEPPPVTNTQTNEIRAGSEGEGGGGSIGDLLGATYSPELEALRKQLLSTNWFAESPYAKYLQDVITGIQGLRAPTGMTEAEKALQLNQLRANIMGQTRGMMRQATEQLGMRGFTPAESGIAGSALADIMRSGQQQFAEAVSNLAIAEAQRRFQEQLAAGQFEMSKLQAVGDIANRFEQWRQANIGLGLQAGSLAAQLEQFAQQLAEQRAQRAASAALAGDRLALERERFEYEKEMDALKLLMNLYAQEQEAQRSAYQPYWQAWLKGY
jgi:hypothetical protein